MDNGTPPRRPRSAYVASGAAFSRALAVALATPIRDGDVAVAREPYSPAIRAEPPALDRFRESMRHTAPQAFREAMAGVSSPPKREGNRAERRAKGRGR